MLIGYESPVQGLVRTMKHFAKPLYENGGYFIFDYDTNVDESSIQASYDHPSYHSMELSVLERIKRDLPCLNFNPEKFEHITVWYPKWNLLAQKLKAKEDLIFNIGPHKINVQRGQSYRTGNSFKYSDSLIEASARLAGFRKVQIFSMPGSTMRVAIYEINRAD